MPLELRLTTMELLTTPRTSMNTDRSRIPAMRVILVLAEIRGGYGSASLTKCLNIMAGRINTTIPATCASGESDVDNLSQANPRQVMSPSSSQTLSQDPSHVQVPPPVEAYLRPEEPSSTCKEEETPTSVLKREEFDVKEEPESPSLKEGETTHWGQPSELPPERSADPGTAAYYQVASSGPREAPWVYVMNELRPVQRREASGRTALEQRVAQLRHMFNEATTERAMSFTRFHKEFQGRGARFEQLRRLVHTGLRREMNEFQTQLEREGVRAAQVTREHEQFSNDIDNTITRVTDAREDLQENYRTLQDKRLLFKAGLIPRLCHKNLYHKKRQHPKAQLQWTWVDELNLKTEVVRLQEHVEQHGRRLGVLSPVLQRLDLLEEQIERWRYRLPDMLLGDTPATQTSPAVFSTIQSDVRAPALRVEICDPNQWSPGDVAILHNQEAKRVTEIGSLIFDTPLQRDYEVRSLLSIEVMEEVDGRLAVTEGNSNGQNTSSSGSMNSPIALWRSKLLTNPQQSPVSIPMFPVFSERIAESRVPRSLEHHRAWQSWFWCWCFSNQTWYKKSGGGAHPETAAFPY